MSERDDCLVACLETLELILECRELLNVSLKGGWWNMAQARVSMGPGAISQLQYDQCPEAIVRLSSPVSSLSPISRPCSLAAHDKSLSKVKAHVAEVSEQAKALHADLKKLTSKESKKEREKNGSLPVYTNPVVWFGVLAPPALRDAQSRFIHALCLSKVLAQLNVYLQQLCDIHDELSASG